MPQKIIIIDSNTINNLYYAGGEATWDKLLEHYDTVIVPDVVTNEVSGAAIRGFPKDVAFKEWLEKNTLDNSDAQNKSNMQSGLYRPETNIRNQFPVGEKNLGEKAVVEVADDMMNKGIYPIIASDEKDFFGKANASDQVKTITPIKTPEIMNDMLDKNTITPVEYQDWVKNSDAHNRSQFNKEDFRDLSKPYDKTIERMDAAREIGELAPKAKVEADQALEAALKDSSPEAAAKVARAEKEKDWVDREGTASVLAGKLAEVEDKITVRVEPGATSIGQLQALSNGIDAEVARQQQQEQARVVEPVRSVPEVAQPTPVAERSGPEIERER